MAAIKKVNLNGKEYQVHPGIEVTDDFSKGNFAEGMGAEAHGFGAHAEGNGTSANADYSHAGGFATIANGNSQTVIGKPNIPDTDNYALIVGNGQVSKDEDVVSRSNAMTVAWDGTVSAKRFVSEEQELELNLSGRNGINITSANDTVYVELDEDYNAFNVSARNGIKITEEDDTAYFEIDEDYQSMNLVAGDGINITSAGDNIYISSELNPDDMMTLKGENISIIDQGKDVLISAYPKPQFEGNGVDVTEIDDNIWEITVDDPMADALPITATNISIDTTSKPGYLTLSGHPKPQFEGNGVDVTEIDDNIWEITVADPMADALPITATNISIDTSSKPGYLTLSGHPKPQFEGNGIEVEEIGDNIWEITVADPMADALPISGIGIDIQEKDNKLVLSAQQYNFVGENGIEVDVSDNNVTIFGTDQKIYTFTASGAAKVTENDGKVTIYSPTIPDQMVYEVESNNESLLDITTVTTDNVTTFTFKPVDPMANAATLSGVNININESSDNKTLIISAHAPSVFDNLNIGDTLTTDGNTLNVDLDVLDQRYSTHNDSDNLIIGNTLTTANNKLDVADNIFQKIEDVVIYDISAASKNLHVNTVEKNGITTFELSADPTNYTFVPSGGMQIRQQGTSVTAYAPEKTAYDIEVNDESIISGNVNNNTGLITLSAKDPLTDAMTLSAGAGINITNNANTVKFSVIPGTYVTTAGNMVDVDLDALKFDLDDEYAKATESKPVEGINLDIIEYDNKIVLSAGGGTNLNDDDYALLNGENEFTKTNIFTSKAYFEGNLKTWPGITIRDTDNHNIFAKLYLSNDGRVALLGAQLDDNGKPVGENKDDTVIRYKNKRYEFYGMANSALNATTAEKAKVLIDPNNSSYTCNIAYENASISKGSDIKYMPVFVTPSGASATIKDATPAAVKEFLGVLNIVPTSTLPSSPDEDTYYLI